MSRKLLITIAERVAGQRRRGVLVSTLMFLLLLAALFVLLSAQPAYAQENVWHLTEVITNPNNERIEFYGGGSDPTYYSEARYEGKFVRYTVTQTSFSIEDRWVDGEEWYHINFRYTFDAPPQVLVPGESYPLKMDFTHSGNVTKGNPGAIFAYSSPSMAIGSEIPLPDNALRNYPWAEVPSDVSSMTWILKPPAIGVASIEAGATLEIYAYGGTPACKVKWVYKAEIAVPGMTQPETTISTPETSQGDVGPRGFTEEEFEKMKADVARQASYAASDFIAELMAEGYIGVVIAATGESELYNYRGEQLGWISPGKKIRIGDTIRTGTGGRLRIELVDRDEIRQTGPSVINVSRNTTMEFSKFMAPYNEDSEASTVVSVIRGAIRVFFRTWHYRATHNSSFSTRAGTAICGIRGSDVLISYNPEYETVAASVYEGLMDVTSTLTDQTVSLTDGQFVLVSGGEFDPVLPMTQQDWDEMVAKAGVEDMQPLSLEELERLLQISQQPFYSPESKQPEERSGVPVLIIVLAGITAAAIGVGMYLLIKSRRGYRRETPPPADISTTSPGFCSHCGSDISSGSNFCKKCGRKLL